MALIADRNRRLAVAVATAQKLMGVNVTEPLADHILITDHAAKRFNERIRYCTNPKEEIAACMVGAKEKHLKRLHKKRRTAVIPTGCCILIGERGRIVTVLKELKK